MDRTERCFFLDWLRISALLLLVLFHVGMYDVDWDYHVKSPHATAALAPWMLLSEPWRMSLLFFVSGAVIAGVLRSQPGPAWLWRRSQQLLLPLLCGIFLVVPPQTYFEVVHKHQFEGGFWAFLGLYYAGDAGFCRDGHCLVMPTWNHLWFLPYLWTYTVLVWGLAHWAPMAWAVLAQAVQRALRGSGLLVWPVLLWVLARLGLFERFPVSYDWRHDVFNHARYGFVFGLGCLLAQTPAWWQRFALLRHWALGLALLSWGGFLFSHGGSPWAGHVCLASMQWCALSAALGYASVHMNQDGPWRVRLTAAVFPVYLFHQTVLIALTQWLAPAQPAPWLEATALLVLTVLLSSLASVAVRPFAGLRPWFGIGR